MGIDVKAMRYIHEIMEHRNFDIRGKSVCLFGNLHVRHDANQYSRTKGEPVTMFANRYFQGLGAANVVSVDINGEGGAIPADLSKPVTDPRLLGGFDLIIDAGTSEHVRDNQYQVFKNAHDICRANGIMIHILPHTRNRGGHGFWKYSMDFFEDLSVKNKYRTVDARITGLRYNRNNFKEYIFVSMLKKLEAPFVREELFQPPNFDYFGFWRYSDAYDELIDGCKQ